MGRFLNPGNGAFKTALNSEIYVDKTGLITYTNKVLDTKQALICSSRPRRFGKSITADMLAAYYGRDCDSSRMFSGLSVSRDDSFWKHLNQHDVIQVDVQWCMEPAGGAENVVSFIKKSVIQELQEAFAGMLPEKTVSLADALSCIHAASGKKFIIILDEWDVLIRDEASNEAVQEAYIAFLRGLFKGTEPTKYLRLAYLTGILPIKKLRTQSALNNFYQYTMINPGVLAPYIGFTDEEVKDLCIRHGRDFEKARLWYDGYQLGSYHVYNPNAAVCLMLEGDYQSYWSDTGTYASIVPLINMDFDGLKAAVITMLSGESVKVKTASYQNDMTVFKKKDDVLTALIHFGYLAYSRSDQAAFIPNEEIRSEFLSVLEDNQWNEFMQFQKESEEFLDAVLDMDEAAVAENMEKIHMEYVSAIQYNNENSLSSVLAIAFLSSMRYYQKPVREMPAGRGFADFVYLPKPEYAREYPALLAELKWNQNAQAAIRQIKEKKYPAALKQHPGEILLIGINYDKKSKEHACVIEKLGHTGNE